MKSLISSLLFLLSPYIVFAANESMPTQSIQCRESVFISGDSVSLNCSNDYCSGWKRFESISIDGNCGEAGSFHATGQIDAQFITGQCNNGFLMINISSSTVNLTGHCANGGTFSGSFRTPNGFANSSCQMFGSASIYLPSGRQDILGSCSNPLEVQ